MQVVEATHREALMSIRLSALITAVALSSLSVACGHNPEPKGPTELATSSKLPASQGLIETADGGNGNVRVRVSVKHLAPPEKVVSGASTYVVWVKPLAEDGSPQNLGAIRPDAEMVGTFESTTPLTSFDVFITAEPSPTAQTPTGEKMLWGRVDTTK
jgi:hypothetical protein